MPNEKQPTPYGICHRCNSPIEIPGLEAYLCGGNCGWVPRPTRTIHGNSSEPHQPVVVLSLVPQPERSRLDLIGQREVSHV